MDNQEVQSQEVSQSTQAESSAAEGGELGNAAPRVEAPQEKSAFDKLREKSAEAAQKVAEKSVNVAAKKPSELAAEAAKAVESAFKPNLKFKAAGKEMDVPEYLRGVMKDEESQKHLHTLLSKAHGIEMIQDKLKTTRERVSQVESAYKQVMEPISIGQEAYRRGDMDSVFQILKMDPNKVLQWAYRKVQLSQMPAHERHVHEQAEIAQRRNWEMERQQQSITQQSLNTQSEHLSQMMDLVLERPDLQAIAQAYDAKREKSGSFRDLVAMMGEQEFKNGKMISVMDAAKMAVELIGEKFGAPAKQAEQAPAPQAQQSAVQNEAPKKIVLPNAGGSKSAAPAKAKVKSLDDIRKLSKQFQN